MTKLGLEIVGISLAVIGVLVMPYFAIQQLYSAFSVAFPITVALAIVLTEVGVHLHYLARLNEIGVA